MACSKASATGSRNRLHGHSGSDPLESVHDDPVSCPEPFLDNPLTALPGCRLDIAEFHFVAFSNHKDHTALWTSLDGLLRNQNGICPHSSDNPKFDELPRGQRLFRVRERHTKILRSCSGADTDIEHVQDSLVRIRAAIGKCDRPA